jgi:hypothetical protein
LTTILVSSADAAHVLGCSLSNITKLRKHGTLRAARRRPHFMYKLADLVAYQAKRSPKRRDRRPPVQIIVEEKTK